MTNKGRSSAKVRTNNSEKWFAALDHRRVGTGANHWDIVVTGVHAKGRDCWIQVASADDESKQFVLHVSPRTTVEAALDALTAAPPEQLPSVLSL
jgi:hypothetical protein